MATAFTSLLGLALPVQGELSGTWGNAVNTQITALLDTSVAGTTTLSTDADVTLTTTTGASNQARQAIILWNATGTVTRNITAPAQSKTYVVINASGGTQSIVLRGAGPTTGVTIAQGEKCVAAWNGTDFVKIAFSSAGTTGTGAAVFATSPTLVTPALGTPSALVGTNITGTATAFTASNVTTNANLTGAITSTGNATSLGLFTSAQLAGALTDETGTGASVFATSPTLVTPALGTPSSGALSNCTADGTNAVGFRNIPQNSQSAAYTLVLADSGKHIFHPVGDNVARTFTIPANSSVAYPLGTAITFINMAPAVVSIAITTDTLTLSSAGTAGTRSLAQYGSATCIKITATSWLISGSGLT